MSPFLSYAQAFSCEISLFCRLKYTYSSFPIHFCFLIHFYASIAVSVICIPLRPGKKKANYIDKKQYSRPNSLFIFIIN